MTPVIGVWFLDNLSSLSESMDNPVMTALRQKGRVTWKILIVHENDIANLPVFPLHFDKSGLPEIRHELMTVGARRIGLYIVIDQAQIVADANDKANAVKAETVPALMPKRRSQISAREVDNLLTTRRPDR